MPIRLIEAYTKPCSDKDHEPDMGRFWVMDPGMYEHTCPSCGRTSRVERTQFGVALKWVRDR